MKIIPKRSILVSLAVAAIAVVGGGAYLRSVNAETLPNTQAPPGFGLTKVTDGFTAPTAARFAPDGRIFVIEKGGAVKIVKNGAVLADPFYVIPNVNNYVDRGLLGLALDPDFATNGFVYLLYTYDNNPSDVAGPKTGQLIRVTANGDKAVPGSQVAILGTNPGNSVDTSCSKFPKTSDCLPADGLSHAPGSIEFGPDKKLYVTIGDAAGYDDLDPAALNAQDIDNLAGKILRINKDGTAPADNPYYNGSPTANRSKVFAYGVRNAFRLTIRPSDGLVMVGDVGWNTWEEVNVVPKGANLGWPCYEAMDQQNGTGAPGIKAYKDLPACQQMYANPPAGLTWPIHYYSHPPSSAVVSGVFYTGNNYPAGYKNQFFYGDYAKNQIYNMQLTAGNTMVAGSNKVFASNAGGPVNFFTGPDGDIYYAAINKGGIYHITYSTANLAPTAIANADKTSGASPLTVNFSSDGSTDPEGDALTYKWDFGDGSAPVTTKSAQHIFTNDGTYTVTLTVTDSLNNTDSKTITIFAGKTAPTVTITAPADMTVANPDQVINFAGSATDAKDGNLTGASLQWQVTIYHCPLDSCHIHNVETVTGTSGSFPYPHHDGPFYIQVTLTATNSAGLKTSKYVSIYPAGQAITSAINFDGLNDYAIAAQSQDFQLQTFTAEAMVKTLSTDDWGSEIMSAGNNWTVRAAPNGNVQFSYWSNGAWQVLVANVNVVDGLWHHVAVTKNTGNMKIYVDGIIAAQSENTNPIQYAYGRDFIIGKHGDGDDHFNFNGAIDEVRVWSAPRTDGQITQYRSTTLPNGQANLLAYYKAEESNGATSADSSAAATHPLTLAGGANWTAGAPLSAPTDTPPAATPITALTDDFTPAALDTAKWTAFANNGQVSQNGTLTIAPSTVAAGYSSIISAKKYELKDNAIYVEVPKTTAVGTSAETQFILELDPTNSITIGETNNALLMRHRVNGTNSDTFKPFDAAAMRWWRVREATGVIYWETSPDGKTWTVQRQIAKAFNLSALSTILQAGTWQTVAAPGTATFDNVNIAPAVTPPAPVNNSLGFNGTATGEARLSGTGGRHYAYQTFTIEAWTKTQATGVWGGEIASNGNNYGIRVSPDGNLRFYIYTGNLTWQNYDTTGLNLLDNQWHHIAVTKNGTTINIYVDGVLKKTSPSAVAVVYGLGNDFVIGRHGDGDDHFNYTGQIDDFRIWNTVRTAAQISANYKIQTLASTTGLTARWMFTGDLTTALKNSVDANNLTKGTGATLVTGYPYP